MAESQTATKRVKIQNLKGLHARATATFVKLAETFQSEIMVSKSGGTPMSGKSIMGLLMLAAPLGETLKITATGSDAAEAVKALADLVRHKFGEDA
ncbi:MAG: HPr family phosphocarrier protein [Alphaproteobacteria bacterium]|nr:HPr family phosphocarrier protein [Alphaproteobacteria bacterium]